MFHNFSGNYRDPVLGSLITTAAYGTCSPYGSVGKYCPQKLHSDVSRNLRFCGSSKMLLEYG